MENVEVVETQVTRIATMRAAGRGPVRRALEALVNQGIVGISEAQEIWRDAFGGQLIAVPASSPRQEGRRR
jgi:hypothetical protein